MEAQLAKIFPRVLGPDEGARLLLDFGRPGGGLHLYHAHPDLQIGPVTFAVALPFTVFPLWIAKLLAMFVMSAAGLAIVELTSLLLPSHRREKG